MKAHRIALALFAALTVSQVVGRAGIIGPQVQQFVLLQDNGALGSAGELGGALAADAAVVVSARLDGQVQLISQRTGATFRRLTLPAALDAVAIRFGASVALAGNVVAVGAPGVSAPAGPGAVFLFDLRNGRLLRQIDGAAGFGTSVALFGDRLVVGSPEEDSVRGAVHVFSVADAAVTTRLIASDRAVGDRFGQAVAVSDYFILVGAPLDNRGRGTDAGSGYLFDAVTLLQKRKLTDDVNTGIVITSTNAQLGSAVAISGQFLILGPPSPMLAGRRWPAFPFFPAPLAPAAPQVSALAAWRAGECRSMNCSSATGSRSCSGVVSTTEPASLGGMRERAGEGGFSRNFYTVLTTWRLSRNKMVG